MDERERLEPNLLDVLVDDTAMSTGPHLDPTKIGTRTPSNKITGLLEEVPAIARQLAERTIAAIRGWSVMETEPTWIKCGMHLLQASTDQWDRTLTTGRRLIKIKTMDASTRCPQALRTFPWARGDEDEVLREIINKGVRLQCQIGQRVDTEPLTQVGHLLKKGHLKGRPLQALHPGEIVAVAMSTAIPTTIMGHRLPQLLLSDRILID